jgi:hypothetical protein
MFHQIRGEDAMIATNFRPRTLAVATAVALGFGISGVAFAEDTVVTAPAPGELVYDNWIELAGNGDATVEESAVFWAVRKGANEACEGGETIAGNVDPFEDDSEWLDGEFAAEVDALEWAAGKYCFALNVGGDRDFVHFFLVDSYAKISGVVDVPGLSGRGNGTHAFDGKVGDAGEDDGLVGSISINYRYIGTECTYTPGANATLAIDGLVATLGGQWDFEPVDADCPALTDGEAVPFTLTGRGDERPRNYRGSVEGPEATGLDGGHDLKTGNVHVRERAQEQPDA